MVMLLAYVTLIGAGSDIRKKFEGPEDIPDSGRGLPVCGLGSDFA